MSKLLICERKSFIKILKAYGLNQYKPNNIKRIKSSTSKTQVLVNQQKQTLQLKVTKEEYQELNQETTHIRLAKEKLQELDHQQSNASVVKKQKENQDSRVNAREHLRKDAINELYNRKFMKFLYYCWKLNSIIPRYSIGSHKKGRFLQVLINHNLLYTLITYTKTINQVQSDFEEFYALITSSKQLKAYAFRTYPDLSHFIQNWSKYKRFKFTPLVGPYQTPPNCWRLGPNGSIS